MSRATAALNVQVGDPIPSIGLRATDGYLLNLRSWVGKSPVAHLFFAGPSLSGVSRTVGEALAERLGAELPWTTEHDEATRCPAGPGTASPERSNVPR